MEIRKGRGYVYGIQYHLVWCVKYRKKILSGEVEKRLKEIVKEQAISHRFTIIELETDLDHIHMLIECSPQHYIPNIVKALKGNSACFLFKEYPSLKNIYGEGIFGTHPILFVQSVIKQKNK